MHGTFMRENREIPSSPVVHDRAAGVRVSGKAATQACADDVAFPSFRSAGTPIKTDLSGGRQALYYVAVGPRVHSERRRG